MNQIPDDLDRRLAEQRQRSNLRHVEFMEWVEINGTNEKRDGVPTMQSAPSRFDFSNLLWENVPGDIGGETAGRHFPVFANANGFGDQPWR
jgi:hypothetical protein